MLYLYGAQEIAGVTVYSDSDPKLDNVFYVMAPFPRLRRDAAGKAAFQLIKFRGGEASSLPPIAATAEAGEQDAVTADSLPTVDGEIAGGMLSFDTEYVVDSAVKEQIRAELDAQVRASYTRQGRTVPEGFQIVLRQPTWTDGEVHLLLEDTTNGLFTCVSKAGKPSLMGNNVASFAAMLAPWQSSLLVSAIQGSNYSPIQVNYKLTCRAKLPPCRIYIRAAAVDCYTMYKQYGSEINGGGICSDPDTVVRSITQSMYSRDVVRVTIDSGGLTIDDKSFQALQEMALGMVQDWVKQEFYKAPPERATKEQIQDIQLQQLSEHDFRDLNIDIEESATVEMSFYPQGNLGQLLQQDDKLEDYVQEVDLSADEFFQNRQLGIKVYADFPAADAAPLPTDVLFVEVTAFYGDQAGLSRTWDRDGSSAGTANGERWLAKWHKIPGAKEVRWQARIQFRDASKSLTLEGTSDKTELNIPVVAPGRARLLLDHVGLPWSALQYVEAKVAFAQDNADPPRVERTFIFDDKSDEQWFDEPIWTKRERGFTLDLSYRLKNGNEIQRVEDRGIEVKSEKFYIETPFEHYLEVPVQALFTTPAWDQDIVDLTYEDPANEYRTTGHLFLSEKGGWRQTWSVPLLDPTRVDFKYYWTRRNQGGGVFTSADVPGAPSDGWCPANGSTIVATGDPDSDEDMLRVVVDPLVFIVGLDDPLKDVIRIVLHLKYVQPDGRVDVDDHVFNKGETAWTWKQHILDKSKKNYFWWAEYYTKPYSKILIGSAETPIASSTETLVLEPPQG